jgi:hypothetical protein
MLRRQTLQSSRIADESMYAVVYDTQLQDVLEALLADADTLRRQQPEQYASLQAELPALATELGLAAQEEGRSGSPEAGDKQLLLGPVLPGEQGASL